MTRPCVEAYTDGSADRFRRGGWAVLLRHGARERLLSGAEAHTTNNRMELRAALEAFRALKRPCTVHLYTDSQYLQKAFTEGWLERWRRNGWRTRSGEAVKNQDLWRALLEEIRHHEVRWHWVEGHAGHPENERVDREAQRRRRSLPRPEI